MFGLRSANPTSPFLSRERNRRTRPPVFAIPAVAIEEYEVIGQPAIRSLNHPIQMLHGCARSAFPQRIQFPDLNSNRDIRLFDRLALLFRVTYDSPHASSLDFRHLRS